jgi:uncharacterized protein YukE
LTQATAGGVADVTREQAAARNAMQDSARAIIATTETIQHGQKALGTEVEKMADAARQTGAALAAATAEQTAARETCQRVSEDVASVAAKQTALGEAVQAHAQTLAAATATLSDGQRQLAGEVRRLQELTQATAGGVADVAREQAAVRGTVQDSAKVISATTETIQQGQRALQAEVEKLADAARQTIASLTTAATEQAAARGAMQDGAKVMNATTETIQQGLSALRTEVEKMADTTRQTGSALAATIAEQAAVRSAMQDGPRLMSAIAETLQQSQRDLRTEVQKMVDASRQTIASITTTVTEQAAGQEMTRRMIGEVANAAIAALALRQGLVTGDVPQIPTSMPMVPAEEGDGPQRLPAAKAITHGEQIRYEVGPDRDNLGYWNNASDWAEWELEIGRPGRFKVAAEIAAVASGRFQVVLADRQLEANAPSTGDYGRFQGVELGTVELTSAGKTRVAVRPVPEGWQPMNLKALDLVPLN